MGELQSFLTALQGQIEPWRVLDRYLGKDGTPADWQKELSQQASIEGSFTYSLCSRRSGKSVMTSALAINELMLPKRTVILVSPTLPQSMLLRRTIETMWKDCAEVGVEYEATQQEMRMANGSNLYAIPAGNSGDGIRGQGIRDGLLVLEEAAYLPADVFDAALPLVEDRGKVALITTPTAKDPENRAYQMWTDHDTYPDIYRIRANAYDQPHMKRKLERAMKMMPKDKLEREYGTAWVAKEGFQLIDSELLAAADTDRKGWTFEI